MVPKTHRMGLMIACVNEASPLPPFPLLLSSMLWTLVPFRLGLLTHPFAFRFSMFDSSAPPRFPILYPCPTTPPPCWNNAWPNATPSVGFSVYYPVRSPFFLLFAASLTGLASTLRWLWWPSYSWLYYVPLIRMKILWGRTFCLIFPGTQCVFSLRKVVAVWNLLLLKTRETAYKSKMGWR